MTLLADIADDISGMYDITRGFAETVTGPGAVTFPAIFSEPYYAVEGGEVSVMSSQPTLRCRNADALAQGASVTVRGTSYTVAEVLPNGYSETLLRLHE